MKIFAISLIFILVITALALCNMLYVNHVVDHMKLLALEVAEQESSDTAMSELIEYWSKHKDFIGISANYKQADAVSEEVIKLETAYAFKNEFAIKQSCALLCDVLDDISHYESFSLHALI